jgi:hypothetical protein
MPEPSVECSECGQHIDEPTDLDPSKRQPCPNCGSLSRNISVGWDEKLRIVDETYTKALQGSNTRIAGILNRARDVVVPPMASPTEQEVSFTADAVIEAAQKQTVLTGELFREQTENIRLSVHALIETERIGHAEAAKAGGSTSDQSHRAAGDLDEDHWSSDAAGFGGVCDRPDSRATRWGIRAGPCTARSFRSAAADVAPAR